MITAGQLEQVLEQFRARARRLREHAYSQQRDAWYAEGYADAVYDISRHLVTRQED